MSYMIPKVSQIYIGVWHGKKKGDPRQIQYLAFFKAVFENRMKLNNSICFNLNKTPPPPPKKKSRVMQLEKIETLKYG